MSLLLMFYPYTLEAKTGGLQEPKEEAIYTVRLAAVTAPQTLIVEAADWPEPVVTPPPAPRPVQRRRAPVQAVKKPPVKRYIPGDCIGELKRSGDLPNRRVTRDGFARTVPVKPLNIAEGEEKVISTKESSMGHVVKVKKVNGNLVSVQEGGHPVGEGRVVDPAVVKGEVAL